MTCDRCGIDTLSVTGSYFNAELICSACDEREREHPDFERARRTESEAVLRGDYNFPGVGLPDSLRGEKS